jgi:hypothetical protein
MPQIELAPSTSTARELTLAARRDDLLILAAPDVVPAGAIARSLLFS